MVQLKDICVSFGAHNVLNNLNAHIKKSDFITIIGANGSGKSTLFDLIAGKIRPTNGQITVDGNDISHLGELDRTGFIARLFQNPQQNTVCDMSVAENLALAYFKGRRARFCNAMRSLPRDLIEKVCSPLHSNIKSLLDKKMGSLSGGQRQMIALIMATLHPPKILLLDEPTAALDPDSATRMLVFTAEFVKKHAITTLMITHDQQLALSMGNRLWVLQNKKIERVVGPEKRDLLPKDLIGQIDYAQLSKN